MWAERKMLQIDLGKLKGKSDIIVNYFEQNFRIKTRLEGNLIIFDDEELNIKKKDIKLYLKKILHREGLKGNNRVLINKETISIIESAQKE